VKYILLADTPTRHSVSHLLSVLLFLRIFRVPSHMSVALYFILPFREDLKIQKTEFYLFLPFPVCLNIHGLVRLNTTRP